MRQAFITSTQRMSKPVATRFGFASVALSALLLTACASGVPSAPPATGPGPFVLPDRGLYGWGWSQKPEDFANVARAQSSIRLHPAAARTWMNFSVGRTPASTIGALRTFYSMHVRWKLKDGREFIVENIDTQQIMRAYLQATLVPLQWQREARPRDPVGDFDPLLTHEVKDDELRIKWVVIVNRTPVRQRLAAGGAANPWRLDYEEHLVASIKGVVTSGIDFNTLDERRRP